MKNVLNFDTISEYNDFNNHKTLHPLVSVIDFSKAKERTGNKMIFGIYCVFLKDVVCGDLKYGRHYYDYQEGTLVFIAPGQFIDVENKRTSTSLWDMHWFSSRLDTWHFCRTNERLHLFNYNTNEALLVGRGTASGVRFSKINDELQHPVDKHVKLIASGIELF